MKILAADDDPIILEILSQFLSIIGPHEMTATGSADEAMALLGCDDAPAFDCFLLDIQMPGTDGMTLARRIRRTKGHESTPIIMLTAMSEKRYIDAAFAAGATDYVTKPFDLTDLKTRINMVDRLVQNGKVTSGKAFDTGILLKLDDAADLIDLTEPFDLHDVENVIALTSMKNYVAQLSRSALFGSTVFAFTLRKAARYCAQLSATDFRFLIEDVAKVISATLDNDHFLMAYAGSGTFICITERGGQPDMAVLTDLVNIHLNQAEIMSNDGDELHPRVSAGIAIRLVWKSGDQISGSLDTVQATAEKAATEHERLRSDFFQMGKTA